MSMFYHCPICWDGEKTCHCTIEDRDKYYKKIEEEKKKFNEANKEYSLKYYHNLLDKSFKQSEDLGSELWELYFLKGIITSLNRGKWLELRKSADDYFRVNKNE